MLFNSPLFLFLFLPATVIVYFLLNRRGWPLLSKIWVASASLLFYGYANVKYLPLISGSILFNYLVGILIGRSGNRDGTDHFYRRKGLLVLGIFVNLALLSYFKYTDFFFTNINNVLNSHVRVLHLALPLGISFFTFTQVAYLIDAYKESTAESGPLELCLVRFLFSSPFGRPYNAV